MVLEAFANLEAIVVRAPYRSGKAIDASIFEGKELRNRAVLVHTGWAEYWATDSYLKDTLT